MRKHDDEFDDGLVAQGRPLIVYTCYMECGQQPNAAYSLSYQEDETAWVYVCEECQLDNTKAPYWWNRALRGESLDDEEE